MPITSVYDLGTVTVTQGSKQVTGTGVNWTGAGLREGDMFWCAGLTVRIESLVSNTEILLAHDWPGSSGSNVSYEVHYTADTGRVLAKSTQLLNEFENNALNPIKALTPSNNKVPYYTGAETASLADFTSLGRSLAGAADAAVARTLLELVKQTSVTDDTASSLLIAGAFGLGSSQPPTLSNIEATTTRTGFYRTVNGTSTGNFPTLTSTSDALLNIKITGNFGIQLYFSAHADSPIYYRRSTASNTWQPWRELSLT